MFGTSPAFASFAVDDIDAARTFYSETLGLTVEDLPMPGGLLNLQLGGGGNVMVYPKPDHTPATFTVLSFPVDDVDKAVDQLTAAGVPMQRYDGFGQDEKGVARGDLGPAIAWFTDPAGNVLAVLEQDEDD
ncbi:MAG TPA: VOC family protein [Actinomycetes bacterium]|nr:VOC family protein [Actinomycetes bacterium]